MKILILGSGGRESALAWKVSQSELVKKTYVIPGNAGMTELSSKIECADADPISFCRDLRPDLVIVGPENLLAQGISDQLNAIDIPVLGPSQKAAQVESSKIFSKKIMTAAGVPTAEYKSFSSKEFDKASDFIKKTDWPGYVIKADGLAAGKGVIVCSNQDEAILAVSDLISGQHLGFAVTEFLIEKKLSGEEISVFALCDGQDFIYLGSACDHKRLKDEDQGPNTGGMGCYSPAPWFTSDQKKFAEENVFKPFLKELSKQGIPFKGFLFAGLMIGDQGISVIEFNARMGDPETQTLMPLLKDDLVPFFLAAATGSLGSKAGLQLSTLHGGNSVHVVMAAGGYPGTGGEKVRTGDSIKVLKKETASMIFPAGVKKQGSHLVSSGGRILGVTAVASSMSEARNLAYSQIKNIEIEKSQYRSDIGKKAL